MHLTVEQCDRDRLSSLLAEVRPRAKVTEVVLEDSLAARQLMATWHEHADVAAAVASGEWLAHQLAVRGVSPCRLKIERDLADHGLEMGVYLEHHVLVVIRPADLSTLTRVADRHDARLSRCDRRRRGDVSERFVNQRWWHADDHAGAATAFCALVNDLEASGLPVVKSTAERVLHDTNVALDGTWLAPIAVTAGARR